MMDSIELQKNETEHKALKRDFRKEPGSSPSIAKAAAIELYDIRQK